MLSLQEVDWLRSAQVLNEVWPMPLPLGNLLGLHFEGALRQVFYMTLQFRVCFFFSPGRCSSWAHVRRRTRFGVAFHHPKKGGQRATSLEQRNHGKAEKLTVSKCQTKRTTRTLRKERLILLGTIKVFRWRTRICC